IYRSWRRVLVPPLVALVQRCKDRVKMPVKSGPIQRPVTPLRQGEMLNSRFSRKSNRHGNSMKPCSASTGGSAGLLPQLAAPVVVSTGVLTAVDPDLVVEDNGYR